MSRSVSASDRSRALTEPRRWSWWARLVLIFGIWLLLPVIFATLMGQEFEDRSWIQLFGEQLAQWSHWALITPVVLIIVRCAPLSRRHPLRNTLIHIAAGVMIAAALFWPVTEIQHWLRDADESYRTTSSFVWFLLLGSVVYWVVVTIGSATDNAFEARVREYHASSLETELARAHLDSLRSQLQPHFLFNTLNAIASLIRQEHNRQAIEMLTRLSDLLRSLLTRRDEHEIPLHEEIDLVDQYLSIERVRFGDRLRVVIEVASEAEICLVPTLILQPLVENAIKHGIARSREGGTITITAATDQAYVDLAVSNDCGPPIEGEIGDSNGVGLANTRARLEHMYPNAHHMEIDSVGGHGAVVRIRIPMRVLQPDREDDS